MSNNNNNKPMELSREAIYGVDPECLTLVYDKDHIFYDPRVELPPDENMVLSIMTHGVLEPVIVNKNGNNFEVVAGRCRVKAAIEANKRLRKEGLKPIKVPFITKNGNEGDLYGILISENEVRTADSAINKGEKMRKLKNMGYSNSQIAVTFATSRQNVENFLAVDCLAEKVKEAIRADEIATTAALELKKLSREDQVAALEYVIKTGEKPTVANVREIVETESFRNPPESEPAPVYDDPDANRYATPRIKPPSKKKLEKRLELFETKGYSADRYLQSKPADYRAGFEYALKWALGREQEDEDFEVAEATETAENKETEV